MEKQIAFVIEDDASVAELFAEALRRNGYTPEVLQSGHLAMNRLVESVPNLVILDLGLPFTSGETLLQMIRRDPRLAKTHVIVTSGEPQRAETLYSQADLVLMKPVSYDQLSSHLASLQAPKPPAPKPAN